MKHTYPIPGHPPKDGAETYHCKGSNLVSAKPENKYHPSQVAYLAERNLYTGRFIVDVAHLPDNLKHL